MVPPLETTVHVLPPFTVFSKVSEEPQIQPSVGEVNTTDLNVMPVIAAVCGTHVAPPSVVARIVFWSPTTQPLA